MLKFLLIIGLLIFVFGRLFKFLLKYAIIGMAAKHGTNSGETYYATSKNTNVGGGSNKKSNNSKDGGEYIDYEVVK